MSAPGPYVTDPFHPLSSVHKVLLISIYMSRHSSYFLLWYVQVCIGAVSIDNCACALAEAHFEVQSH